MPSSNYAHLIKFYERNIYNVNFTWNMPEYKLQLLNLAKSSFELNYLMFYIVNFETKGNFSCFHVQSTVIIGFVSQSNLNFGIYCLPTNPGHQIAQNCTGTKR